MNIWKKGDERAPHKPLLILYTLGLLQTKGKSQFSYEEVREGLKTLLEEFGPPRKTHHPEQPFVRLAKDSIWKLNREVKDRNIYDGWLRENQVFGMFLDEVYSLLKNNCWQR